MTYNFQNGDILNSPDIIRDIDCSIPCNIIFYFASCCPTKVINYFPPTKSDFIEIIMILLSLTPYPTVFLFLCLAAYCRASRSIFLLALMFIENFIVIFLKMIIQEPRPNFLCNNEYGFPSNHSCFFTCIAFWFILEEFFITKNLQFKYKSILIIFYVIYPFILYSRYYLNYHSIGQIIGGVIIGIVISMMWFFFCIKYILSSENIFKEIMIKLNIENNMTHDLLYQSDEYILLDSLIKKQNELSDMKEKLKKLKNNIGSMDNIKEFEEKYRSILEKNNEGINEENMEKNYVDNKENLDEEKK